MNNTSVKSILSISYTEIKSIKRIIKQQSSFHSTTPYLTKYAVIKACGTIEVAFKAIIADFCTTRHVQLDNFIEKKVRRNSMNPSYDNMCSLLKDFDSSWQTDFKQAVKQAKNSTRLHTSINSLVEARNQFAHGGNPAVSIESTEVYYIDSMRIIKILDSVVR